MKTLKVQMCVYKAGGAERLGVLIHSEGAGEDTTMIVDFAKREIVNETVEFKAIPDEGSFSYNYGYTPEMRKTIKESRRLARVE